MRSSWARWRRSPERARRPGAAVRSPGWHVRPFLGGLIDFDGGQPGHILALPWLVLARVNALIRVMAWTGVPIGAVLGGTLTQLIGVRWVIGLASGLALLLFLVFALVSETKRI